MFRMAPIPVPIPSSPPAGGNHYATPLAAGFYEDNDPETQVTYPEGNLVHSLEHGYVIFWYNCQVSDNCETLKEQIRSVMREFSNAKVIAFPWADMDVPLAMTSWGRLLEFPSLDLDTMRTFVRNNRNKSPEPNCTLKHQYIMMKNAVIKQMNEEKQIVFLITLDFTLMTIKIFLFRKFP